MIVFKAQSKACALEPEDGTITDYCMHWVVYLNAFRLIRYLFYLSLKVNDKDERLLTLI